jgi:hypothetical protein
MYDKDTRWSQISLLRKNRIPTLCWEKGKDDRNWTVAVVVLLIAAAMYVCMYKGGAIQLALALRPLIYYAYP